MVARNASLTTEGLMHLVSRRATLREGPADLGRMSLWGYAVPKGGERQMTNPRSMSRRRRSML
jgi:hypothetical protein